MQQGAVVESSVYIASLSIDFVGMRVSVDDCEVHLTPIEFRIIELLSRHRGKVLIHDMILKNVLGPHFTDTQTLRVNMANIRRKIESNPAEPQYIRTEIGVGYRMVED